MGSRRLVAVLLAALVLLSGCSGFGGDGAPTVETAVPSTDAAPTTTPTTATAAAATDVATASATPTPVDSDGDGLNDRREAELGTDPNAADTDGDGLTDYREAAELRTDPTAADTDADGLDDDVELEGETNPRDRDSDNDGLADGAEIERGTDPNVRDTDGDNLLDGWEVHSDAYPGADPLYTDIFVEIDYMRNYSLPAEERDLIQSKFASAPVPNPNGTNGIDLHLVRSDRVPYTSVLGHRGTDEYEEEYFDHDGQGYHYAILVDQSSIAATENRRILDGAGGRGLLHVSGTVDDTRMGTVFMHELGHSLGLTPDLFRGVDQTNISFAEYPSMMSYNSPNDYYGYSSGNASDTDFDDWGYVEEEMYTPIRSWKPLRDVRTQCVDASFAGGNGTDTEPYRIETLHQLECIGVNSDAHYELVTDIDATWRTGFDPTPRFSGTLDGNGHTIRGLTVHRSSDSAGGIVDSLDGGTIERLHLRNVSIRGNDGAGGVAASSSGTIREVTVTGTVRGDRGVGGVVGGVTSRVGVISRVETNATVFGEHSVGGLAGNSIGNVTNSAVFGSVRGESDVGGLVGMNYAPGRVASSFAAATVNGQERVGGVVGRNYENGPIEDVYWDANVTGQSSSAGSPGSHALTTAEMTGKTVPEAMSGLGVGDAWVATDGYPVLDWLSDRITRETVRTEPAD